MPPCCFSGAYPPAPAGPLTEAVPLAKVRGMMQVTISWPERISGLAIVLRVPVTIARVMFAPKILTTAREISDDFKEEIARIRLVARDAAVAAGLWIRSRHGTWRFFLVTPDCLTGIPDSPHRHWWQQITCRKART